jgi:large subunit ribosomal protein L3
MGGELVTVPKVKIAEVDLEKNLILLQGTVPGKKNNFVIIRSRG